MHPALRNIFAARANAVLAASESFAAVRHSGLKGQLREMIIAEFFQPLLPPTIGVGQGQIVDSAGNTSTQQDVIIYDRALTPPALVGNAGIFPIDTVLYSFEIKSTLDRRALEQSHENALQLLALKLIIPSALPKFVLPGLIAFNTTLTADGISELARYQEVLRADPRGIVGLRMFCVANRGYWFYDEYHNTAPDWTEGELARENQSGFPLLDVLSAILTGYEKQRQGREPDLNSYLMNTGVKVAGHPGLEPTPPPDWNESIEI